MNGTPLQLTLSALAGVASGFINTLSGGGSYLVLPMLLAIGLPAQVANATNRVGVLVSGVVGFSTLQRKVALPRALLVRLSVPMLIGGIAGAFTAVHLDPHAFDLVIGALLLGMLGLVLWKPERFLKPASDVPHSLRPRTFFFMLMIGFHGGFIQAGVGLFLLAALVLDVGLDLVRANTAKILLVLLVTAPALLIFGHASQVDWKIGLLLAVGQSIGAFAAAHFATKKQGIDSFIRKVLIVVLPATTIKLWFFS